MKALLAPIVAALAGLMAAGQAHASPGSVLPVSTPYNAPIYSSFVTNCPDGLTGGGCTPANANFPMTTGTSGVVGSPLSQEFDVSMPMDLTSLVLRLSDNTPADGGSMLVYLVPDPTGAILPPNNGSLKLTGATLLATIADLLLPTSTTPGCSFPATTISGLDACDTLVSINDVVSPGDYWISLVNGSDVNNGGSSLTPSSGALWWRTSDNIAYDLGGATGLYNSHVNATPALTSQNMVAFEMQVNGVPEPASLALLGAGLAGLGVVRRRRAK